MELDIGQIADAEESLGRLVQLPLSAGIAFRLARLGLQVTQVLRLYHLQRGKLVQELGTKVETGWEVRSKNLVQFNLLVKGLREEMVIVEFAPLLTEDDFGDTSVQPLDVMTCHWLFEDVDLIVNAVDVGEEDGI